MSDYATTKEVKERELANCAWTCLERARDSDAVL